MIHRSLNHQFIVKFYSHFDDANNIYMILELCSRRSLMELQKRRKFITEPEVRYYLSQLLDGCNYLHSNNIIHRDLKLGNIFLDASLNVKIGDFGLATSVKFIGERKKTLCGTPNYIAPEILAKKGHSFEVDVWSIGCIIYTLLVGRAPFETRSLKETYKKIQNVEYNVPSNLSSSARNILACIFQQNPSNRPQVTDLMKNQFMTSGFRPAFLPESCLTTQPHFENITGYASGPKRGLTENQNAANIENNNGMPQTPNMSEKLISNVTLLRNQMKVVIETCHKNTVENIDDAEDPALAPIYWISKWVDYSDRYGFGYQLCDNSYGCIFNDCSQLIQFKNKNYQYINTRGEELFHHANALPTGETFDTKRKLIDFFKDYMQDRLMYAGSNMPTRDQTSEDIGRLPYLVHWERSSEGIGLLLSNATFQFNFSDHTKLILCPLMAAVTYIDFDKTCRTFKLTHMQTTGAITAELWNRLMKAFKLLNGILDVLTRRETKQVLNS